ncbi:MAG: CRTAC1 family protein [Verrucomicrobia bacterium]|nr:CRTAC1 family protein [Verrucomicrobiota bacterium]MDA1005359.1 CRTAC1 family protein [Verrucomicrobiota bacterium]
MKLTPVFLITVLGTATNLAFTFTDSTSTAQINHKHQLADVVSMGFNNQVSWMPGGAVAEDFNGDGLIDIYALQFGPGPNLLYINCGGGVFKEEGSSRGAALQHVAVGASAADFDGDGDIDICVTSLVAPHYVLENDGTGNFSVCLELPKPQDKVMSPSWGDFNNDGQLDLIIGRWETNTKLGFYWNLGSRNLQLRTPITASFIYSPVFADINGDRASDLLLTSDFNTTRYFTNNGGGSFTYGGAGSDENGMGTAVGDYDNDGDLDWFVTAIKDEDGTQSGWGASGNRLYRNDGSGVFTDVTDTAGIRDGYWGWGAAFADFDLDGDLDLFHVNGWPETFGGLVPEIYDKFGERPARLYENLGGGIFQEVALASGADDHGQGRGVAVFDLENDGDLDIFIVNNQDSSAPGGALQSDPGTPVLLRNDTVNSNHWLKVHLAGKAPLHSHGIGSRVYITAAGVRQMRELNASTGFLAHGPNRIAHFGVGASSLVAQVRALWTNGDETLLPDVSVDQAITVESPCATVSSRCVVPGESVTMTADSADYPVGASLEWSIGGTSYANPGMVTFATTGTKTLRLDVYDGTIPTLLLRTELLQVEVANPPLDTDSDLIPDWWEMANFLNKNLAADAAIDNDKDGRTSLEEYWAGTNPNDFKSVLSLQSQRVPKGMKLTWPSVFGKSYRVLHSLDLVTWSEHPDWIVPAPGTGGMNEVVVPTDLSAEGLKIIVETK